MCDFLITVAKTILYSPTLGIILGALIAGHFAFKNYRKQKDRENINKRYFQDGIEALINYLEKIRLVVENNYANSLTTIDYLLDLKKDDFRTFFEKTSTNEKISSTMPHSFLVTLGMFENNMAFGNVCIAIFIKSAAINEFYGSDFPIIIKRYLDDGSKLEPENKTIAGNLKKAILERHKDFMNLNIYKTMEILENILFTLRKLDVDSYEKLIQISRNEKIKEFLSKFTELK